MATSGVRWYHVGALLLPLIAIFADSVTDVILVVDYWRKGYLNWCLATFLLVIIPAILVQLFSIRWHLMDEAVTVWHWISHICLLGILHRYILIIKTAFEAMETKSQHDIRRMYLQHSDICMLHLFESFLEAAPQLLLQLYIMVVLKDWHIFTGISAIASLCSLSWAIVNYLRVLRRARVDKACIRSPALVLQVIWRGSLLLARISALLLFAVGFHNWIFVLLGVHWLTMTIWVIHQKTDFCPSRPEEIFYNCIVGVIYCFCFFNLKEGQARYRMFAFYTIMITQNITCLLLYFFFSEPDAMKQELVMIATGLIIGGTLIGICSMFAFYRWFHPSGHIKCFPKKEETCVESPTIRPQDHQNNKPTEDASNYTLRSLKKPWLESPENPIKDEGISLENSPQSEVDCTDKKLLLDHWIARAGSPTFASAPIDKNETIDVTGVEFYSVANTPDKYNRSKDSNGISNMSFQIENDSIDRMNIEAFPDNSKSIIKNKRRGICPPTELSLKFSTLEKNDVRLKDLLDAEMNTQKRRGICSSDQLENEENISKDMLDDMVENIKSVSEISSNERQNSLNEKTSSDSINFDLDFSFSDINSSDINEFNENIVQKLCLSTLKNIKNVHQDADIQNIQKIALEILKDLYSKGGVKDDQDLESELSSSVGRDLETPSEVLSTHDYENICAVNIAREAWGLRSWRACADMGASPPPPPIPARRNPPISHGIDRDQFIDTVAYELSRCDDSCQHRESPDYLKEPVSTVFVAKPYVIDQNGGMFPLSTPLEPILEEIDEMIDTNNSIRKRHRHSSESTLVATIDEIRHDASTNSPRNVYHRADWDSPISNSMKNESHRNVHNHSLHSTLQKNLWKRQLLEDEHMHRNDIKNEEIQHKSSPKKKIIGNIERKFDNHNKISENTMKTSPNDKFIKTYNNSIETKLKNIPDRKQIKNNDNVKNERHVKKNVHVSKSQPPKKDAMKTSPKIKTVSEEVALPAVQEHNLSYEEVIFLSQLVSDSDSFLFKKSSNNVSQDEISNIGISSSLQSLIDKDSRGSVPLPKTFDSRANVKRNSNRPRRKFSLLREKFELKSKHSDEEMLFQSLESIKSISQKSLDVASSRNLLNSNPSVVVGNQESKIVLDKENLTPPLGLDCKVSPVGSSTESVVLSLTPCDIHQPNTSVINLKEKRSLFLKQVLSPPKMNSWNKK